MVAYAAIWCPVTAPAPITILPPAELSYLADKLGHPGAGALATWSTKPTSNASNRIYLPENADGRLLCHEIKHINEGQWHDTKPTAPATEPSTRLPAPHL